MPKNSSSSTSTSSSSSTSLNKTDMISSPKVKQLSINDYLDTLTKGRNTTSGWINPKDFPKYEKSPKGKHKKKQSLRGSTVRTSPNKKSKDILLKEDNTKEKTNKISGRQNQQYITEWFNKKEKQRQNHESPGCSKDNDIKTIKSKSGFKRSNSFEKYGVALPSIEEILEKKRRNDKEAEIFEEYEKCLSKMEFEIPDSLKKLTNKEDSRSIETYLDCKHLNEEDLGRYLKVINLEYLRGISNGEIPCERNERYKDERLRSRLRINDTILVFSQKQIQFMLDLLEKEFKECDYEYFLLVMLPELCLRIFMDCHEMNYVEAVKYLQNRPYCD